MYNISNISNIIYNIYRIYNIIRIRYILYISHVMVSARLEACEALGELVGGEGLAGVGVEAAVDEVGDLVLWGRESG